MEQQRRRQHLGNALSNLVGLDSVGISIEKHEVIIKFWVTEDKCLPLMNSLGLIDHLISTVLEVDVIGTQITVTHEQDKMENTAHFTIIAETD